MKSHFAQERIHIFNKEIGVLEIGQKAEVECKRKDQQTLSLLWRFALMQRIDEVKIDDGRCEDHKNKLRRTEAVKQYAGKQNDSVFHLLRHKMVQNQKGGEKVKKEKDAAEYHL